MTKMISASSLLVLIAALPWTVEVNGADVVTPALITGNWTKIGNTSTIIKKANEGNSSNNFITNGEDTPIEDFPYIALLLLDFEGYLYYMCSGVLVTRKKVVTTAHCTRYMEDYDHYVAMGIYNIALGLENPGSQLRYVKKYKRHNGFSSEPSEGFRNDIAMLTLYHKVYYNSVVQPASLAKHDSNEDKEGLSCLVAGYGENENSEYPDILQSGTQVTLSNNVCRLLWQIYPESQINRKQICSMYYPVSACYGDSGGPLTCKGKVVGLTSWADSECAACTPTVFTRISEYRNWMSKH